MSAGRIFLLQNAQFHRTHETPKRASRLRSVALAGLVFCPDGH